MRLYSFYALFMSFYQSTPVTCQGEYGVSADVFSFGILLHEMLSGVRRIFFILFSKDVRILQPVRMYLCPLGQVPFGGRNEAALCLAIMGGLEAQEGHG